MCIVCVRIGMWKPCDGVSAKSEDNFVELMIPSFLSEYWKSKPGGQAFTTWPILQVPKYLFYRWQNRVTASLVKFSKVTQHELSRSPSNLSSLWALMFTLLTNWVKTILVIYAIWLCDSATKAGCILSISILHHSF